MVSSFRGKWSYGATAALTLVAIVLGAWYTCKNGACQLLGMNSSEILGSMHLVLPKIVLVALLFLVFKAFQKIVLELIVGRVIERSKDPTRYIGTLKVMNLLWWVLYFILFLTVFVGDVGKLAASVGLIGLGLTFALQKPIVNFVGWLTIRAKSIYREGDRIEIGAIKGDVKEIQVMNTVLDGILDNTSAKSNKVITFPNELVLTSEVQNLTKDSNYVLEEVKIVVTYESNYRKSMKILHEIIEHQIRKNLARYIKRLETQRSNIDQFINKIVNKKLRSNKKEEKELDTEAEKLKKDKESIDKEVKQLEEIREELQPKIRVEMLDSGIQLLAQFLTPYELISKNKTEINLAFLDTIKNDEEVEVAYPHMQLITNKLPKLTH